jgi:hypothetical protein
VDGEDFATHWVWVTPVGSFGDALLCEPSSGRLNLVVFKEASGQWALWDNASQRTVASGPLRSAVEAAYRLLSGGCNVQ